MSNVDYYELYKSLYRAIDGDGLAKIDIESQIGPLTQKEMVDAGKRIISLLDENGMAIAKSKAMDELSRLKSIMGSASSGNLRACFSFIVQSIGLVKASKIMGMPESDVSFWLHGKRKWSDAKILRMYDKIVNKAEEQKR